jgi:hypothetical protein
MFICSGKKPRSAYLRNWSDLNNYVWLLVLYRPTLNCVYLTYLFQQPSSLKINFGMKTAILRGFKSFSLLDRYEPMKPAVSTGYTADNSSLPDRYQLFERNSCLYQIILKMEARNSSEILLTVYRATRNHISEIIYLYLPERKPQITYLTSVLLCVSTQVL